jgi:hypothetical protein
VHIFGKTLIGVFGAEYLHAANEDTKRLMAITETKGWLCILDGIYRLYALEVDELPNNMAHAVH